jgi:ribonuclease P/MRP protein subunit POP3
VLSRLILSLEGVAAHHASKVAQSKQRRIKQGGPNKRRKTSIDHDDRTSEPDTSPDEPMGIQDADQESVVPTGPAIIPHLVLGINQVTKRLEHQARAYRLTTTTTSTITDDSTSRPPPSGPISVVFVCRADVDPPLLISHLPTLIASCNSSRNALKDPESYPPVRLVPVPKGSESLLADATGLRRLAVLALDVIVLSFRSRSDNCADLYLES